MKTWQGIELKEQESTIKKEDNFKMKYDNSHYGKYGGIKFEEDLKYSDFSKLNKILYPYIEDNMYLTINAIIENIDKILKEKIKDKNFPKSNLEHQFRTFSYELKNLLHKYSHLTFNIEDMRRELEY